MTIVMNQMISKSQFKTQLLAYLREVEEKKQPLIITHAGKPVAKVVPYKEDSSLLSLRDTVLSYKDPTHPIGETWEVMQ